MNNGAITRGTRTLLGLGLLLLLSACGGGGATTASAPAPGAPTPTPSGTQAHPRMILDAATLQTLRARAAANTPQWVALKAACDSLIGGTVNYPTQNTYPNLPNLGQGYQGESYLPALLNEAMCYQVLVASDPTAAAPYENDRGQV